MMTKPDIFDVLVVYSSKTARSAANTHYNGSTPFPKEKKQANYHKSYAYLLEMCAAKNISAAFTTSDDIVGTGTCSSYWIRESGTWRRRNSVCYSELIFDKFFPKTKKQRSRRAILFSSPHIRSFSNPELFSLFHDKLATHESLPIYSIPTVGIDSGNPEDVENSLVRLKGIMIDDLEEKYTDSLILKDRFGAGGVNVHKIHENHHEEVTTIISQNKTTQYVLQPYIDFSEGYVHEESEGNTEIRLIFLGSKMMLSFIRSARKDEYICNQGQGGIAVEFQNIPLSVREAGMTIAKKLNKPHSVFALDFIISNSGKVFLLEGNISPGIDWNDAYPENVALNKELINIIVKELSRRINLS